MNNDQNIPTNISSGESKPFVNSYWVIPGIFLAGSYPGFDDNHTIRTRLTAFLKSGIDRFFDLTGENELPPYDEILAEEANDLEATAVYQRFSIMDLGLPSKALMTKILDAIDNSLENDHKVYLHCWGGVGRTGTVVGCHLVRHGLSGKEAIEKLAEIYETAGQSRFHPRSPETDEQMDFILNWHEHGY
jgi:hypothetical protein